MKKLSGNIFVLMLAALVMYATSGVNVYSYCCDACRSHGSNFFSFVSCSDVHNEFVCECSHDVGHHHHECHVDDVNDEDSISLHSEPKDDCHVRRLIVESEKNTVNQDTVDLQCIEMLWAVDIASLITSLKAQTYEFVTSYQSIKPTSRLLLCLNSTFII